MGERRSLSSGQVKFICEVLWWWALLPDVNSGSTYPHKAGGEGAPSGRLFQAARRDLREFPVTGAVPVASADPRLTVGTLNSQHYITGEKGKEGRGVGGAREGERREESEEILVLVLPTIYPDFLRLQETNSSPEGSDCMGLTILSNGPSFTRKTATSQHAFPVPRIAYPNLMGFPTAQGYGAVQGMLYRFWRLSTLKEDFLLKALEMVDLLLTEDYRPRRLQVVFRAFLFKYPAKTTSRSPQDPHAAVLPPTPPGLAILRPSSGELTWSPEWTHYQYPPLSFVVFLYLYGPPLKAPFFFITHHHHPLHFTSRLTLHHHHHHHPP